MVNQLTFLVLKNEENIGELLIKDSHGKVELYYDGADHFLEKYFNRISRLGFISAFTIDIANNTGSLQQVPLLLDEHIDKYLMQDLGGSYKLTKI